MFLSFELLFGCFLKVFFKIKLINFFFFMLLQIAGVENWQKYTKNKSSIVNKN
jgi:hypothetical protein